MPATGLLISWVDQRNNKSRRVQSVMGEPACPQPQRVVLPEAMDARVLAAAEELTARGLAKIILLGDPEPVQAEASRLGIDISKVQTNLTDATRPHEVYPL